MKRVKFWYWINGQWTRITLQAGQRLTHETYYRHEEGWSKTFDEWHYSTEDDCIYHHWISNGRDCDGYLESRGHRYCMTSCVRAVTEGLMADDSGFCPPGRPDWIELTRKNRDQSAEMMGY